MGADQQPQHRVPVTPGTNGPSEASAYQSDPILANFKRDVSWVADAALIPPTQWPDEVIRIVSQFGGTMISTEDPFPLAEPEKFKDSWIVTYSINCDHYTGCPELPYFSFDADSKPPADGRISDALAAAVGIPGVVVTEHVGKYPMASAPSLTR